MYCEQAPVPSHDVIGEEWDECTDLFSNDDDDTYGAGDDDDDDDDDDDGPLGIVYGQSFVSTCSKTTPTNKVATTSLEVAKYMSSDNCGNNPVQNVW